MPRPPLAPRAPRAPLAFRVPNPPPTFVGREAELRAVRSAIGRGAALILAGPGGIGKTALVASAVRAHLGGRPAVMVSLREAAPFAQLLLEILRALAALSGRPADWSTTASEDELLALALDLADEHAAVVVIDDLHHALPRGAEVLVAAVRHAKRAKLLATSRVAPDHAELVGQVVTIGPLPDAKLAALGKLIAPERPRRELVALASAAGGSPWKLRRLLEDEKLDATGRAAVETLAAAGRPVEIEMLRKLVGSDVAKDLERRGWIEKVGGGVRLHGAVKARKISGDAKERVAAALEGMSAGDAITALRLRLELGDIAGALAICDRQGDAILREGYAPVFYMLLDGPELASWKLRAGMHVASVDVLRELPRPTAPWDRVRWVRALLVDGAFEQAARAAEELAASDDERVRFWAGLLGAMAVHHHRDAARGVEALRALAPPGKGETRLRDAVLAFWVAECGDPDGALDVVRSDPGGPLELDVDVLGAPPGFFWRYYRMAALMEIGRLDQAHAAFGDSEDLGEELSAARIAGNALANLAIARGKLDEASERLERLKRKSAPHAYRDITALLEIERRLAAGETQGIPGDLASLADDTRTRTPLVHAWCTDTAERIAMVFATPLEDPLDLSALPLGAGTRGLLTLRRALRDARWGKAPVVREPADVEGRILHASIEATVALVAGRNGAPAARRALAVAEEHGWGIRALESRVLLVECLLVSGEDASREIEALRVHAALSPRFLREADALAQVRAPVVTELEAIAEDFAVAPTAARRARAVLDSPGDSLDAVDRAVLSRFDFEARTVGKKAGWQRGWGIDTERHVLFKEDGTTISLERHGLAERVLLALARRGGSATFEEVALDVWRVKSFRPDYDGNRIRVTMHRVRGLAGGARRVVLKDSSYALCPDLPFRIVSSRSV